MYIQKCGIWNCVNKLTQFIYCDNEEYEVIKAVLYEKGSNFQLQTASFKVYKWR